MGVGRELDWGTNLGSGAKGRAEDNWLRLHILTLPSPIPPNSSPQTCTHIPTPRVLGSPSPLAHTRPNPS